MASADFSADSVEEIVVEADRPIELAEISNALKQKSVRFEELDVVQALKYLVEKEKISAVNLHEKENSSSEINWATAIYYPFESLSIVSIKALNESRTPSRLGRSVPRSGLAPSERVAKLQSRLSELQEDIAKLSETYDETELQKQIDTLHEYNEIKDVGQMLFGKLAEVKGTTTSAVYSEFELDLDD
ncbi:DNA repair protein SWI5 homolog [Oscarella lobularis]|uniref:DNA repair protein SWI5 homolog n=1 Tax=Oscarella lobularis TaxID=121494 RepID=UPI00331346BE